MRNELKQDIRKIITYIQKELNSTSQTVQKQIQEVLLDFKFIREGLQAEKKEFAERITPLLTYDFYMSGRIICGPEIFQDKAVIILSGKGVIYMKRGLQETEQEKYWINSISRYQKQGDYKKIQQIQDNSDVELLKQNYIQQNEYFHSGTGICLYKKLCNLDEEEESTSKIEYLNNINIKQSQILIVAEEDCHVLYIDRKNIIKLKQNLKNKQKKIEEIVLSFSGLPFTDEEKINFSYFIEKNQLLKSTILYLEKEKNQNTLYFIKQGEVEISQGQFKLESLKQNMVFGFEHISQSEIEMKQRQYTAIISSENASLFCIQTEYLMQYFPRLYNFLINESQSIVLKYKKQVQMQKEIQQRDSKRYQIEQQLLNGINLENKQNNLVQKQSSPDILLQVEEINGEYKYKVKFKSQFENEEQDSYKQDIRDLNQIKQKLNYNIKINRKNHLIIQNERIRNNSKINNDDSYRISESTRKSDIKQINENNRINESQRISENMIINESMNSYSMKNNNSLRNSENSKNEENNTYYKRQNKSGNLKNSVQISKSPLRKTKNSMQKSSVDILNYRKPADLQRIKQNVNSPQLSMQNSNIKVTKSDHKQSLDFITKTQLNKLFSNKYSQLTNISLDNKHLSINKNFKTHNDQDIKYQKDNIYHIESRFSLNNKQPEDRSQRNEQNLNNNFQQNNQEYGFNSQQQDNKQQEQVFQNIIKFQLNQQSNSYQNKEFKDISPTLQSQIKFKDQKEKQDNQSLGLSSTRKLLNNSSQRIDQYNLQSEDTINQFSNINQNHNFKSEGNSPLQTSFSSFEKQLINYNSPQISLKLSHNISKESAVRNSKTPDLENKRSHKRIQSSQQLFEQNSSIFNLQQFKNIRQNSLNRIRMNSYQSRDLFSAHVFDENQQNSSLEQSVPKFQQSPLKISGRQNTSNNQNQIFGAQQHYYQNKNIIDLQSLQIQNKKPSHHQHSSSENIMPRDKEKLNKLNYQSQYYQNASQINNEFNLSFDEDNKISNNNYQSKSQEFVECFKSQREMDKKNILSQYKIYKQRQLSQLSNQLSKVIK